MRTPRPLLLLLTLLISSPALAQRQGRPDREADPKALSLTIEGQVEGPMVGVAADMTRVFFDSYPKLLERFENPEKPAPRRIRLIFREGIDVPAFCSGDRVVVSVSWLTEHPDDLGMLTHELTHAVQAYPRGAPGWLTEGIADYSRKVLGPADQPNWSLPEQLGARQNYDNSYRVSARFLEWLESAHPGTVDKIHRALQKGEFKVEQVAEWTGGKDFEALWKDCLESFQPAESTTR